MKSRSTTADRILEAARRIFNEKGYASTSLTEIALAVGISQGNLTYHFPTKKDLVTRLEEQLRLRAKTRRANLTSGTIQDDYVEHLLFGMEITWDNRFLLRDRVLYTDVSFANQPNSETVADFQELESLLKRIKKEGLFRRDLALDLHVLTRSLWIVSRYWMDYLRDSEGLEQITWSDQERGIQHHYAVLLPCLIASAKRDFETALAERRATRHG
ncbi:MAG: TetR/AcrR family transcriptional regulator [Rhodobiaceae bacterium]|nr:TetR/AcrR family transcriptional regulator [Rhodobiaceae bacterium]